MKIFRDLSIKYKLTLIIMLTSSVALLLACIAFVAYDWITFRSGMPNELSMLAEIIGDRSMAALTFDDPATAEKTLAALSAKPSITFACIYTVDGTVFSKYNRNESDKSFSPPPPETDRHRFEKNHLILFHEIFFENEIMGTVYIRSDLREIDARVKWYSGMAIVVLIISSLVAFLISARLQTIISKPILHLSQIAKTVSEKRDYSVRATKHSNDELGVLIDAFNRMLTLMQRRDTALREAMKQSESAAQNALRLVRNTKLANLELAKEIGKRSEAEMELEDKVESEQLIATISTYFINLAVDKINNGINYALEMLGALVKVDHSYIYLFSDSEKTKLEKAYHWSGEETKIEIEKLKEIIISDETTPWFISKIKKLETILISRLDDLPPEANIEKEKFQSVGIKATVNVPMMYGGDLIGFLGFDSFQREKNWSSKEIKLLKTVGEIVVNALERKQAEEALRESEERFRQLAENIDQCFWLYDPDQNEMLYISPAYEKIWGDSVESLLENPTSWLKHIPSENRNRIADTIPEMVRPGYDGEFQILKNKELHWLRMRTFAIRSVNNRVCGTMEDITARKLSEEQLKAYAKELERSNRELQDFAYVASHDLQEPLRKIRAFGDRLQSKYNEELGDKGKDYLRRMQNAAARMQTLITDLLTYSRVTTKAQPFALVDLNVQAQKVISDLEIRIEQTNGRIEIGDLPTIEADPLQMRQLIQNLISNGLKYRQEDVAPVVKLHSKIINDDQNALLCQIMVEDNGIGFEEKYVDRIFGIFQRLHGRTAYEGTGVGLAICRKIVDRHGGNIKANSVSGEGSTFIVNLPIKQ